jgi:hypothetical protein
MLVDQLGQPRRDIVESAQRLQHENHQEVDGQPQRQSSQRNRQAKFRYSPLINETGTQGPATE